MTSSINAIVLKKLLGENLPDTGEDVMMVFAPNIYLVEYLKQTGQQKSPVYATAFENIVTCKLINFLNFMRK